MSENADPLFDSRCEGSGRFTDKHRCQVCGRQFVRSVAPEHERPSDAPAEP